MTININLDWDSLDPRWEVFNKTELAKTIEGKPSKAICKYPLFLIPENKIGVIAGTTPSIHIGTIAFTAAGLREILDVKKLSRHLRECRTSYIKINQYILNLQQ